MHIRLPFATNDNDTLTQNTDSEFKMKRNDLRFIQTRLPAATTPSPATRHNDDHDANDNQWKREWKKRERSRVNERQKGLKSNTRANKH